MTQILDDTEETKSSVWVEKFKALWDNEKFSLLTLCLLFFTLVFNIIGAHTDKLNNNAALGFHPKIFILLPIAALILSFVAKKRDNRGNLKKFVFYNRFPGVLLGITYTLTWFGLYHIVEFCNIVAFIFAAIVFFKSRESLADELEDFLGTEPQEDEIPDDEAGPGDFFIGHIYKRNVDEDGHVPEGEDEYIVTDKKAVLHLHDRFVHVLVLGVTGTGKTSQCLLPMFNQDFESDDFEYEDINVVQMGQIVLEPKGDFAETAWAIGKYKEASKRKHYQSFLMKVPQRLNDKIVELWKDRESRLKIKNGQPLTDEEAQRQAELEAQQASDDYGQLPFEDQLNIESELSDLYEKENGRQLTQQEAQDLALNETAMQKLLYVQKELPKYIDLSNVSALSSKDKFSNFGLFRFASLLTNIIANPIQCDDVWEELIHQDPLEERDLVMLFDPQNTQNTLYFNPLFGEEESVKATVTSTLISFMEDSSEFFKNQSKVLCNNCISVVKRVYGNDATLDQVLDLMMNNGSRGEDIVRKLGELDVSGQEEIENRDLSNYFLGDYYTGMGQNRQGTKTYEQTSGIRNILSNLLSDSHLNKVLNPPPGIGTSIDFDKILLTGDKVALSTATGASDTIGKMLGAFIMLQLQQAIGRRPGKENTRTPVIMYIDEFQDYASGAFEDVLTKGRSYCVSATMATQTLGIVAEKAGQGLVDNLQSNARNVIVYPGASVQDAKYFMSLFGNYTKSETNRTISQAVQDEPTRMYKVKGILGIGDDDGGDTPRESISEKESTEYRFDESQIIYGPNVHNDTPGKSKSFGSIYYRIVKNKSNQMPSVAEIQYIPYSLKKATDKIVQAYESVRDNADLVQSGDTNVQVDETVDPLADENEYSQKEFEQNQNTKISEEETERATEMVRDKTGKNILETKQKAEPESKSETKSSEVTPIEDGPQLDAVPDDVIDLNQNTDVPDDNKIDINPDDNIDLSNDKQSNDNKNIDVSDIQEDLDGDIKMPSEDEEISFGDFNDIQL